MSGGWRFEHEWMIAALALLPLIALSRRWFGRIPILLVPYAGEWTGSGTTRRKPLALWALYAAFALLVIGSARPQWVETSSRAVTRGYDVMLAIDLSSSMLAEDYAGAANRLEAVRPVIEAFIQERSADRIGVVALAREAHTLSPPTRDHEWLGSRIAALRIGMIEDGTAIGDGLGLALANLEREEEGETTIGAFVVLLTDGANTSGSLTPPQATAIARHREVPVYAVAAGREGMVPFPVFDANGRRVGTRTYPSSIDLPSLRQIASATSGRFFRAEDGAALTRAFAQIDAARAAEDTVLTQVDTNELYHWFVGPGLLLLLLLLFDRSAKGLRGRPVAA